MGKPFVFLLKLAWESRYRIPLIITIGFMALGIRMQFEINIEMNRILRTRPQPIDDYYQTVDEEDILDDSSDSWITTDEEETDDYMQALFPQEIP